MDPVLAWRADHPLLAGLSNAVLSEWARSIPAIAVQLPADAPALEIGCWRRELPGDAPVPIDALVVTRTLGRGRIVFCQLPLLERDDPRGQILLHNLLAYCLTRPEPTVPPSQRARDVAPAVAPVPTIAIPSGDRP